MEETPLFEKGVPTEFGNYRYVQTLGGGQYSLAVICEDFNYKKKYCAKIIDRILISKLGMDDRVAQEIEIHRKLKHPNIAEVYDIIANELFFIIIMEYCPCGNLYDFLVQSHFLPEWRVFKISRGILDALQYLHQRGISHRDLKLENLVFDDKRNAKIIDFGFSVEPQRGSNLRYTICGTLDYTPPEIILNLPYDARAADIWSMGIIMYALAFGTFPFTGYGDDDIARAIVGEQVSFPTKASPALKEILSSMLDKDPAKRPTASKIMQMIPTFQKIRVTSTEMSLTKSILASAKIISGAKPKPQIIIFKKKGKGKLMPNIV